MYYLSIYLISVDMNLTKVFKHYLNSNTPAKAGIIDEEKCAV